MNTINPNDPAFPINIGTGKYSGMSVIDGMSIRTEIATRIAIGLCSFHGSEGKNGGPTNIALRALEITDALIAELNK